jgi:hypothetical protein
MNGDRRILVGMKLNLGLYRVTFEQEQPLGTGVHSVAARRDFNEIHRTERAKLVREYCRSCCIVPAAARSLNSTPLELDRFLNLLPPVWIWFHFEARVLHR